VATGSAAAAVGLVVGDEILNINGRPARSIALYTLRERFKGPLGTRFKLRVHSDHGDRTVALTLADQV
jgi:C-terminal processing protease CtpA/Prc